MATETWALVEINGHRSHLGRVQETKVAGVPLTQVDDLQADGTFKTFCYGAGAFFGLHPSSEEEVRKRRLEGVRAARWQACPEYTEGRILPGFCEACARTEVEHTSGLLLAGATAPEHDEPEAHSVDEEDDDEPASGPEAPRALAWTIPDPAGPFAIFLEQDVADDTALLSIGDDDEAMSIEVTPELARDLIAKLAEWVDKLAARATRPLIPPGELAQAIFGHDPLDQERR